MMKFGIGQPVTRLEDTRLVQGRGRFQDDQHLHGELYTVFVRSPYAHARIKSVDTAAATAAPGVVAVYTGADYAADGLGMPKANMPRKKMDGTPMFAPQRPAMMVDRVRYVGDTVAMVIAETLAQAKDAADLVDVDYEELPSVTSTAEAATPAQAPPSEPPPPAGVSLLARRWRPVSRHRARKHSRLGYIPFRNLRNILEAFCRKGEAFRNEAC